MEARPAREPGGGALLRGGLRPLLDRRAQRHGPRQYAAERLMVERGRAEPWRGMVRETVLHPVDQRAVDIRALLVPVLAQMFPSDDETEQLRSGVGEQAQFPLPGAPQRRPIVCLLQPQVIPLIAQYDQARIG